MSAFLDPLLWQASWMTLLQSFLSAGASILVAWPLARLLWRYPHDPVGRLLRRACWLNFVLPPFVVCYGLLALLDALLLPISGLGGIVLCHLFMNLPFALMMLYERYCQIPPAYWQQAQLLRLSGWQRLRFIEYPLLKSGASQAAFCIIGLCMQSLTPILLLGQGPQHTTLPVYLYEALIHGRPILGPTLLLMIGAGLCLKLCLSHDARLWPPASPVTSSGAPLCWTRTSWLFAGIGFVFFLPIVMALLPQGSTDVGALQESSLHIWRDTGLIVCLPTLTALALVLGLALLLPFKAPALWHRLQHIGAQAFFFPHVMISVFLFIACPFPQSFETRMGIIFLANVLYSLPILWQGLTQALLPALGYKALISLHRFSLNATWRYVMAPLVWPHLLPLCAFIACWVLGHLMPLLLFGSFDVLPLPRLLYNAMVRFDMATAQTLCLQLTLLCLGLLGIPFLCRRTPLHKPTKDLPYVS